MLKRIGKYWNQFCDRASITPEYCLPLKIFDILKGTFLLQWDCNSYPYMIDPEPPQLTLKRTNQVERPETSFQSFLSDRIFEDAGQEEEEAASVTGLEAQMNQELEDDGLPPLPSLGLGLGGCPSNPFENFNCKEQPELLLSD